MDGLVPPLSILRGMIERVGAEPNYPIASVDNAMRILELVAQRGSLRVTDASKLLGIARSSAHRLLTTLEFRGFVQRAGSGYEYEIGPTLISLVPVEISETEVAERLDPTLRGIAERVRETVSVVVLDGADVRFIAAVEGPALLRVSPQLGLRLPAHCTSGGKAILADLPKFQFRRLYPQEQLPTLTKKSVRTRTALVRELSTVRRLGYGTNIEESAENLVTASATIAPGDVRPPLAFSIAAPAFRVAKGQLETLGRMAVDGAAEVADALIAGVSGASKIRVTPSLETGAQQ